MVRLMACSLVLIVASCGGRSGLLIPPLDGQSTDGRPRSIPDLRAEWILDPRCPLKHPDIGDPCSTPQLRCSYERCLTEGKSDLTYLCVQTRFAWEGRWDCLPNPPGCPSQPPADLTPCSLPDAVCRWAPGSKAHCWPTDNLWHLFTGV